ncbi:MAG TPA: molybdopterin-dependent oxidoreductase, partial [Methylophilaceae bacterium]|nr:molybdopterin-dependent oxidoreductase [Methylophilaceae bacterium]
LAQGLGSRNIDYRLRHSDFRLDGRRMGVIWMGCNIPDIQEMDRILVIGSNLRNEHPLLAQRIRKAVANGAELSIVNPLDDDPLMRVAHKAICLPNDMVNVLAQILKAMSGLQRLSLCLPPDLSELLQGVNVRENTQAMAESLAGLGKDYDLVSPRVGVFLGNISQHHPRYSELFSLAEAIASLSGATFGALSAAANSVGCNLVCAMPEEGGLNARSMLESPRKVYVLVNLEPEFDCHNPAMANKAMEEAECVIALTSYKSEALRHAHVMLPISPFTETSGTFMSMEGRVQSFTAVTRPLGETRPGWKVLRVLGNTLGLSGFDHDSSEEVKNEIFGGQKPSKVVWNRLNNNLRELGEIRVKLKNNELQRIGEIPQYQSDAIVRRSPPLQKSKYVARPVAAMSGATLEQLGLHDGDEVIVRQGEGSALLQARRDDGVPMGGIRIAGATPLTAELGDLFGEIMVERVAAPVPIAAETA